MTKTKTIEVQDKIISIIEFHDKDYICLTDMLKAKDGDFFITDWLRNRNTLEFIEVWEKLYNPNFNYGEFAIIKSKAGLNNFKVSVKELSEKTHIICITAKSGKYGGTYAHKDIAFEFGTWISPTFKLYLIHEYQRLKEVEYNSLNLEWNFKRVLTKMNYHIQTDAIKNHIIPISNLTKETQWIAYAEEADLLNVALFSCSAKQWRDANPKHNFNNLNIRDFASINELAVLSNLESLNAEMINKNIEKQQRFNNLLQIAKRQIIILNEKDFIKSLKKLSANFYSEIENIK
jgi:hypothetical protein